MCRMVNVTTESGTVRVASIKKKYMHNLEDAARKCDYIDKVVLFGSCTSTRCREESDIDVAVFGSVSKGKCLTSKTYEQFLKQVFSFDDFRQSYDILYFKTGRLGNDSIISEIERGEVLYDRTA